MVKYGCGEETDTIKQLADARTAAARVVERARMIWLASQGRPVAAIAAEVGTDARTVAWVRYVRADVGALGQRRDHPSG